MREPFFFSLSRHPGRQLCDKSFELTEVVGREHHCHDTLSRQYMLTQRAHSLSPGLSALLELVQNCVSLLVVGEKVNV